VWGIGALIVVLVGVAAFGARVRARRRETRRRRDAVRLSLERAVEGSTPVRPWPAAWPVAASPRWARGEVPVRTAPAVVPVEVAHGWHRA